MVLDRAKPALFPGPLPSRTVPVYRLVCFSPYSKLLGFYLPRIAETNSNPGNLSAGDCGCRSIRRRT